MQKPFVIYRSSAGSGKTYTLSLEYLKLALKHPGAYRSILAVTFTNKATQEMKGRILLYLYQVAKAEVSPLRTSLAEALDKSEIELSLEAGAVLENLLHGYSYFSVMTIDAFFQKVVRGFAREMGLQAGFRIELDTDRVLEEVIDQLLLEIGESRYRQLRSWLTRFAEEKVEEGSNWDFRREIKQLAFELFKEEYREKQYGTDGGSVTPQSTSELLKELRGIQQAFEQRMGEIGEEAIRRIAQLDASVEDISYGRSGVAGYLAKLADRQDFIPGTRVLQAEENREGWVSKKHPQRERMLEVAEQLLPLLTEALQAYREQGALYHSVIQLQRFLYAYGILHHLEDRIQQYKRENDLMLISDAPVFLQDIIGKDDTPFIYEKIGSYFQHFLIDEFQDTSGLQWMNFRPLVENSLDSGYQNLVVGDVKQSIYRWRGGDWQLLLESIQQDMQEWRTQVKDLDQNFRSRRHIIEFNNALFRVLPAMIYEKMAEETEVIEDEGLRQQLREEAAMVQRAYQDASQKLPDHYDHQSDWHGHVRIQLLDEQHCTDEEEAETDWRTYVQQQLPSLVEELQDRGYAAQDIAFLVRDKRDGRAVVDTFMQYKNEGNTRPGYDYEVISSESLFLNASLTVKLLVDLLQLLDYPEDALVRASILYKYHKLTGQDLSPEALNRLFGAEELGGKEELEQFLQPLPSAFRQYYAYLNKLPLYELVENLIQLFQLNTYDEKAYLQAFQDVVLQYSKTEQGDLHTFLAWWRDQGQESSVQLSEETNAMRVMTIHKAKGLQFKVVILPFCDWTLDHHPFKTNILWTDTGTAVLPNRRLLPMKYSTQLIQTLFSREYYEEKIRVHIDHLNLLYVAFTRAEEGLYAYARPKSSRQGKFPLTGIANLLRRVLPELSLSEANALAGWDEMAQVYEIGESAHLNPKASPDHAVVTLPAYPSVRWRNRLSIRPLSQGLIQTDVSGWKVSHPGLMQQLFIQLKSYSDIDSEIEKLAFEQGLTRSQQQQMSQQAALFMEHERVRKWYQPGNTIFQRRALFLNASRHYLSLDRVISDDQGITLVNFCLPHDQENKTKVIEKALLSLARPGATVRAFTVDVTELTIREMKSDG